jgi:hypothetical protein
MLIDEPKVMNSGTDPVLAMIAMVNGRDATTKRLQQGIYEVGHFGSTRFLREGYEHYPDLGEYDSYGVCDGMENLLDRMPILQSPDRSFVVTLTKVKRDVSNKGQGGGWRWHKWGEYIGTHQPTTEYLDDEPLIECVYVYRVYERKDAA